LSNSEEHFKNLKKQAEDDYGKLPRDQYLALLEELTVAEHHSTVPNTFREDYEFYGAEEGTVYIRYSGYCKICTLQVRVSEELDFFKNGKVTGPYIV
jgi:hypothetical protein